MSNYFYAIGKSESQSRLRGGLRVFFSILIVSFFMWSGALDRYDVLLSYSIVLLVYRITIILIIIDIYPLLIIPLPTA